MPAQPPPDSLLPWALRSLGLGSADATAPTVVAGDASSRRYFRARLGGRSYVLVDAPPQTENNDAFLAVHALLQNSGVRIPALLDADLAHGYLLLEDLGDTLLLPRLAPGVVDQYYRRAFDILLLLAQSDCSQAALPDYDATLLQEELGRFPHWFVGELLGHSLSQTELALLRSLFDALVGSALEQPRVLVHRDFHSRNLMLPADGRLAVIDFQDAVRGPVTYDLVSLLRDCYVSWPAPRVRDWALHYRELLLRAAALDVADADTFLRWFDLMGLQRHIKVLGTFARLYLRDDKPGYLADLPLVLRYTLEILAKYAAEQPQCAEALRWFDTELMPRARQQTWGAQL